MARYINVNQNQVNNTTIEWYACSVKGIEVTNYSSFFLFESAFIFNPVNLLKTNGVWIRVCWI